MFISHKYKAIFVHIQRTGGNSIQKIFEECDPDLIDTVDIDPAKNRTKHCFITDIQAALSREIFSDYTKFCVVRNPFDRMVSWYSYFQDAQNPGDADIKTDIAIGERFIAIGERVRAEVKKRVSSFTDFVFLQREAADGLFERFYTNQFDYVSADGKLLVDKVLKFEDLAHQFCELAQMLRFDGSLPHVNQSSRSLTYRDHFSASARDELMRRFQRDCDIFGYEF